MIPRLSACFPSQSMLKISHGGDAQGCMLRCGLNASLRVDSHDLLSIPRLVMVHRGCDSCLESIAAPLSPIVRSCTLNLEMRPFQISTNTTLIFFIDEIFRQYLVNLVEHPRSSSPAMCDAPASPIWQCSRESESRAVCASAALVMS
jgi:hypothetical protein